jgi:hypothetical protein
MDGKLHLTVTGKPYRGKGLPGIADVLRKNQLSNLNVITNDVIANIENDTYRINKNSFEGTLISWEINHETKSCL